ncbi:Hypothetical protein PHPALM_11495 [Phytophthora palmivora]|uniref:Uncharacterized protein n=1 Tax=Phytophthora palmivora TaxID=4796 RepID=A0A2P4Y246_9STRA|nr:Hypothetical protein PHPALM_11495 [Phytophthora palmivora]
MHRAEKSSSKICRAREVEKAQEVHRKKITDVKSYLCGIISKPVVSRSSTSFRLRPATSISGSVSSRNQPMDEFQRSLAKMEEFRGVAPVLGLSSDKTHRGKLAPPSTGSRKKSLNGSFRTRRLKEIKVDNAEVFNRIRKSVSHYSNDDLKRDWQKNVSYLSSISEFPNALVSGHKQQNTDAESRSCFGPSPRRPSFLSTTNRPEPLPSIPVVVHPIKSIPSSPKKLQLNIAPAFRSLRKAMPQQPSLPPISTTHTILNVSGVAELKSIASDKLLSPRGRNTCPGGPGMDDHFTESTSGRSIPYRSSTADASTKFIGDLCGGQPEVSGDAKYQLLKTGRFVGGTYLVLTVFCGDGVTNPYGFDVIAYHGELQCEYKLSITKEMTHELLDRSSSSSKAAETAAAAGTNLCMQEIARNICNHINFALLGLDEGEMIFLAPSLSRKSDQAMRFDASPDLVAFCLHQTVEITRDEVHTTSGSRSNLSSSKRRSHVFASTRPTQSYPARSTSSCSTKTDGDMDITSRTICFQVMDTLPLSKCTPCESIAQGLKVEVSVDELYDIILDSSQNQQRTLSMERMVVAAIQHLHIISVPCHDDPDAVRNELIVNSHVNTQLRPCSSRPVGTATLEKKRSRQQFPHSTSQLFTLPTRAVILIQSGLIWRNCYFLAEVSLDHVEDEAYTEIWSHHLQQRKLIQNITCDLIVSVFNSNSGRSTNRRLSKQKVCSMLERLNTFSSTIKPTTAEMISEQHTFARYLLTFLQLDVDLFGQEVIIFPSLERSTTSSWNNEVSEKTTDESTSPEVHVQEILPRATTWEDGNISEGDESAESDANDEEWLNDKAELSAGIEPQNTDEEEERDEADANFSSYANQDEHDMNEDLEDPKTLEHKIENDDDIDMESSTRRQWRQGRKIDGHFCLLQGSPDNITIVVTIASSGQLHVESQQSV